jgi:hypothetical protein
MEQRPGVTERGVIEQACKSCGVIGSPHGSDVECVAALRAKIEHLNGFVEALLEQSARRRPGRADAAERPSAGRAAFSAHERPARRALGSYETQAATNAPAAAEMDGAPL